MGPFLNPVEQNNPSAAVVVEKVCRSDYAPMFRQVASEIWGIENICGHDDPEMAYGIICIAIAAFESSDGVNQFTSKYDYYLKGEAELTAEEELGLELFEGKTMCADCHPSRPGPGGEPPLFTDFTYDNLGIPRNPKNPWYKMGAEFNPDGENWVDPGLGGFLKTTPQYAMFADENYGKHRVPTLRNVDMRPDPDFVKVFGHNGYFESLEQFMHFYNTRDVLACSENVENPEPGVNCWPPPEVSENLNTTELGDLGLTAEEEAAVVAFMRTLTDGYEPQGAGE
jgi:cytochrome c peroxidase